MSYKVVIIDDKPIIRESLIKTINWSQYDCTVVAQGENGIEGKNIVNVYKPDIVITDIKMPGLDGLELSEYIAKALPDAKVIIITGYQEFEYAKRAISLGVVDLILKPIDNVNLENILSVAIGKIKQEQEQRRYHQKLLSENNRYKDKVNHSLSDSRSRFISDILQRRKNFDAYTQQEIQDLRLDKKKYVVMVMRARSSDENVIAQVLNRQRGLMRGYEVLYNFEISDTIINQDMVILILYHDHVSARESTIYIKEMLQSINSKMKKEIGAVCCVSLSQLTKKFQDINDSYKKAMDVLNSYYFLANEDILFSSKYNLSNINTNRYIVSDLDRFYRVLEEMNISNIDLEIKGIVNKIIESSKGNIFIIKCLLSEICITLIRHYFINTFNESQLESSVNDIMTQVDALSDVKEAQVYLKTFIEEMKQKIHKDKPIHHPMVKKAIDYINENYNKEITLDLLAAHISVNPSYLSRLLKKEVGKNFTDIITGIRINKAKHLLNEHGSKIIEVGEMVGYSDYAYFYQVFKRIEGISPSQYRKTGKKI